MRSASFRAVSASRNTDCCTATSSAAFCLFVSASSTKSPNSCFCWAICSGMAASSISLAAFSARLVAKSLNLPSVLASLFTHACSWAVMASIRCCALPSCSRKPACCPITTDRASLCLSATIRRRASSSCRLEISPVISRSLLASSKSDCAWARAFSKSTLRASADSYAT